jgi:DNA repair protein RadC
MAMYLRELTIRFGTARAGDGERVELPVGGVVASPRDVANLLYPLLAHEPVEVFSVLCLSVKHRIVGYAPISRGTLDSTLVHPRKVFRTALMASAASICLVHNHPSGDPRPSPDDDLLTVRLVACGDLMGIEVVDHIIVGEQGYFSYREAGRLQCLERP